MPVPLARYHRPPLPKQHHQKKKKTGVQWLLMCWTVVQLRSAELYQVNMNVSIVDRQCWALAWVALTSIWFFFIATSDHFFMLFLIFVGCFSQKPKMICTPYLTMYLSNRHLSEECMKKKKKFWLNGWKKKVFQIFLNTWCNLLWCHVCFFFLLNLKDLHVRALCKMPSCVM